MALLMGITMIYICLLVLDYMYQVPYPFPSSNQTIKAVPQSSECAPLPTSPKTKSPAFRLGPTNTKLTNLLGALIAVAER